MLGSWSTKRSCPKILRCSRLSNLYEERPQAGISGSSVSHLCQNNGNKKFSHTLSHNRRSLESSSQGRPVSSQGAVHLPPVPTQRKPKAHNIIPSDLHATIQAHREANTAAIIRKRVTDIPDELLPDDAGTFFRSVEIDTPQVPPIADTLPKESKWRYKKIGRPKLPLPPQSTNSKTGFPFPWRVLSKLEVDLDSGERLSREIRAFEAWSRPTKTEEDAVNDCKERFERFIGKVDPSWSLEMHGSRATGLAGPLSDLDYVIQIPDLAMDPRKMQKASKKIRHNLKAALDKSLDYKKAQYVSAKIPTLTVVDKKTGLEVQVISSVDTVHTTEFVKYYLTEYPQLRPLYLLLRRYLKRRKLGSATKSGLSSYPTLVVILTALTHAKENFLPDDLSRQLLHILDFWANADCVSLGYAADPPLTFPKFSSKLVHSESQSDADRNQATTSGDPDNDDEESLAYELSLQSDERATTETPGPFARHTKEEKVSLNSHHTPFADSTSSIDYYSSDPYLAGISVIAARNQKLRTHHYKPDIYTPSGSQPYRLCLQDPADPTNDVGRATDRMREIQLAFRDAYEQLTKAMRKWDEASLAERHFGSGLPKYLIGHLMWHEDWGGVAAARERVQMGAPGYM